MLTRCHSASQGCENVHFGVGWACVCQGVPLVGVPSKVRNAEPGGLQKGALRAILCTLALRAQRLHLNARGRSDRGTRVTSVQTVPRIGPHVCKARAFRCAFQHHVGRVMNHLRTF